jgi:hypothetical protein
MSIDGTVSGDREVVARLQRLPGSIRAELVPAMGRITLKLMRTSVQDKLSGQVLKRKTGTLARAVTQSPRTYETPDSVVGSVGIANITGERGRAPVKYGRIHEFGFTGTVTVREHLRTIKQAFGRSLATPVQQRVREHSARRNLPARSFLRSALRDLQASGVIAAEIQGAIAKGMRP